MALSVDAELLTGARESTSKLSSGEYVPIGGPFSEKLEAYAGEMAICQRNQTVSRPLVVAWWQPRGTPALSNLYHRRAIAAGIARDPIGARAIF